MRRQHQYHCGDVVCLEDRRVPSHAGITALAHLPAAQIAAHHAHVVVRVGHPRGVFVHAPAVNVSVSGGGGVVINVPGFHGQFPSFGVGVNVNVSGLFGRF